MIAVASILMGMGIGVLSRLATRNRIEATRGGIRALLRAARNASLQERYGAVVHLDAERSVISAQLKTNLTGFRFESTEVTRGAALDPGAEEDLVAYTLSGIKDFELQVEDAGLYDPGRTGTALLFARPEAWAWIDDAPILRVREGIHVEVWILPGDLSETLYRKPQRRGHEERYERAGEPALPFAPRAIDFDPRDPPRYHVTRRGKAWALAITANYEVEVSLMGEDENGVLAHWIARTKPETLSPHTWYRLELAFDGGPRPRLSVDGIARALYPLDVSGEVPRTLAVDASPISLSDSHPDRGFFGAIDELRLAALVRSEAIEIPTDIALITAHEELSFDRLGQLDPTRHPGAVSFYLCDDLEVLNKILPDEPERSGGTITQAELQQQQQAANLALGEQRVLDFEALLDEGVVPDGRWAKLTVERTGLVE